MVKSLKLGKGQGTRFRVDANVQIAMVGDQAIFAMAGAEQRLKAHGHWPGHSTCSYLTMASFLKIPPPPGNVIIRYANDRLSISTLKVSARWAAGMPPVAVESKPPTTSRVRAKACPECGTFRVNCLAGTYRADTRRVRAASPSSSGLTKNASHRTPSSRLVRPIQIRSI